MGDNSNEWLSPEEVKRAEIIFDECIVKGETVLNQHQLGTALSLWGHVCTESELHQLYESANSDGISKDIFVNIVNNIRVVDTSLVSVSKILEHFEALYYGTCFDDRQVDKNGKYLKESDLRMALVTNGDPFTDEEVEELIRECKPIDGKIYFDQYKTMLLDPGL